VARTHAIIFVVLFIHHLLILLFSQHLSFFELIDVLGLLTNLYRNIVIFSG